MDESLNKTLAWLLGGFALVVVLLLVFQFFLRYQYIQGPERLTRIDRLSGSSCEMPCTPPPPTPKPTPFNQEVALRDFDAAFAEQTQAAIAAAQASGQSITELQGNSGFSWGTDTTDDPTLAARQHQARALVAENRAVVADALQGTAVRLICYCDDRGAGYRWEVNTLTDRVSLVNDNADLTKKYHLAAANQMPVAPTPAPSAWPVVPVPGRAGGVPASILAHPPTAPPTPLPTSSDYFPTPPPTPALR